MGKAKSAVESQVMLLRRAWEFVVRARSRISISEVYVVGSRARGDYTDMSDIDLVIISDDVRGMDQLERRLLLKDFIEPRIEFFIYTTEEWDGEVTAWIRQLKREAVKLVDLMRAYGVNPG
ncbi:nucleotidyltransferase domain-containing protein [Vulcanisaeta distributa]|uniref:nucleotidyltransferase domain-containing protein n=1 Tax=Vulcanisaeta distributa TaxID=164451 RepID=UPI000AA5415F|nr:nucleotidyltransferase domain-containing protein [Vulcanisaeta distributa]